MNRFVYGSRGLVVACAILLQAGSVYGSEESERLYSRGLTEFHAGRYEESIRWFNQSAAADSGDVNALYYRAMAQARLSNFDSAVTDLRGVLAVNPDFPRARLELGSVLIEAGRYDEAIEALAPLSSTPGFEGRAAFFRGLAQLRQGRLAESEASFEAAARQDPNLASTSAYYRGVIALRRRENQKARQLASESMRGNPSKQVGSEANAMLQRLDARKSDRRYMLYAEAGLQFDSNVCLLPDDNKAGCFGVGSPNIGVSRNGKDKEDGRGVFTAGATVQPLQTNVVDLTLGYEFFQSAHFNNDEFNLQNHRPRIQLTSDFDFIQTGLLGQYDYYLLQTDSFLNEYSTIPWLIVPEGEFGRTEVYYRMRYRDFEEESLEIRTGYNHAVSIRQAIYLGSSDSYVYGGFRFDAENPKDKTDPNTGVEGQYFAYNGYEPNVGVRWNAMELVPVEASLAYRYERYDETSRAQPGNGGKRRHDDEFRTRIYAEIPWSLFVTDSIVGDIMSFGLGYSYNINESDKDGFDYDRHMASMTVQARY